MPTVIPHLHVSGASAAIDYYKRALGAVELMRVPDPDGKRLMHASLRIGDSVIMLADDYPELRGPDSPRPPTQAGGNPITLHVNSPDVDKTLADAAAAGGVITMPAADQFWGDRYGQFRDPFGHHWSVSTTIKKLSPEALKEAGDAAAQRLREQQQQQQ